jgi:hypothetical protein
LLPATVARPKIFVLEKGGNQSWELVAGWLKQHPICRFLRQDISHEKLESTIHFLLIASDPGYCVIMRGSFLNFPSVTSDY